MRTVELNLEPATQVLDRSLNTRIRDAEDVARELETRGYTPHDARLEAAAARNLPGWEQTQ